MPLKVDDVEWRKERAGTNSAKMLNTLSAISQANQFVDIIGPLYGVSLKLLPEVKLAKSYFYTGILLEVKGLGR